MLIEKGVMTVDLDDVILPTAPLILRWYHETFGVRVPLRKFYSKDPRDWGVDDPDIAIKRIHGLYGTELYRTLTPSPRTIRIFSALARYLDQHISTGRPGFVHAATEYALDCFPKGTFQSVTYVNSTNLSGDIPMKKSDVARALDADYHLEDHLAHVIDVAPVVSEVFLFGNYPWNQTSQPLPANVTRIPRLEGVLNRVVSEAMAA